MGNKVDLKKFICSVPFTTLEIHSRGYYFCCPSWLVYRAINLDEYSLKEIWNCPPVTEIRESILDGSYRYCDKELCPYLNGLLKSGYSSEFHTPLTIKNKAKLPYIDDYIKNGEMKTNTPNVVFLNVDRSCNFKCPSCRTELINSTGTDLVRIQNVLKEVEDVYSQNVQYLYVTASGDPFASPSFRTFLRNFNPDRYKHLMTIHIHTNASLWTEKMWNSMPNIHRFATATEISIDAGTKETYENIVRINGKWDILMDNLKYINTIKTMTSIKISFVVQKNNYKEMLAFTKIIREIFGNRAIMYFGKIINWGTYTEEEFDDLCVWNPTHPEHDFFLEEFNKVGYIRGVFHNMHEFLKPQVRVNLI